MAAGGGRFLAALRVLLTADTATFEQGMDKAASKARAMEREFARSAKTVELTGKKLADVGKTLTVGLTLPLAGAGAAAFKLSTDFNRSMANVGSLIPGATARVAELKRAVQDLAVAHGKDTQDLAAGLYQTISAFGDRGAESMKVLEINSKAAAGGVATTRDAIDLTSAVTKAYGDTSAAAVQGVSDLALETVRLGQTTFPELAASIGRVTPLTSQLKVSQQELFAVLATATGVTGGAAEVNTQLRGVLQGLMSPTEDLVKLYRQLGVASGEQLIQQRGLQGAIAAIVQAAQASGQPLQKYLSSIEGQTLALALAGPLAQDYTSKLTAMGQAAGATDRAFAAQTQGVNAAGFAWEQFKQRLVTTGQRLGDAVGPGLTSALRAAEPLLRVVENLSKAFAALPPHVQTGVVALGALALATGPVLLGVGNIIRTVGLAAKLAQDFGLIARAAQVAGGAGAAAGGAPAAVTATTSALAALKAAAAPAAAQVAQVVTSTGALTAASVLAAGAVGVTLGGALLRHGDTLRGVRDHTHAAAEETGLLRGAWILLGDVTRGVIDHVLGQLRGWLDLTLAAGQAAGQWALQFAPVQLAVEALKQQLEAARWAWDQVAETASLTGDLFYEAGRAMYDQGESAGAAAARAHDLAAASKIAGYAVTDWATALLITQSRLDEIPASVARNDAAMKAFLQTYQLAKRDFMALNEVLLKGLQSGPPPAPPKPPGPTEEQKKAAEEWLKKVRELTDSLSGKKAAEEVRLITAALAQLGPHASFSRAEMQALQEQLTKLAQDGAKGAAEALQKVDEKLVETLPVAKNYSVTLAGLGPAAGEAATGQVAWFQATRTSVEEALKHIRAEKERAAAVKSVAESMLRAGQITQEEFDQITGKTHEAAAATETWSDRVRDLAAVFEILGIKADSGIGRVLGGLTAGAAAIDKLKKAGTLGGKEGVGFSLGNILKTPDGKTTFGSLLGGITGGLQAASAVVGIGKAIIGLFKSDPVKKAAKEAGKIVGEQVSRDLAQKILDTSKALGTSLKTATLLNLPAVMAEAAAKGKDPRQFSGQITQLFDVIKQGGPAAQAAVKALGESFGQVAEAALASGTAGDRSLRQIIRAARETGHVTKEIKEFIQGQVTSAVQGIGAVVGSFADDKGQGGKLLGGLDLFMGAGDNWQAVLGQAEENGRALARRFFSTFQAMADEVGIREAAKAMGEPFERLKEQLSTVLSPEELEQVIGPIQRMIDLSNNPLFAGASDAVTGLKANLEGLANADLLQATDLKDYGTLAQATHQQLLAGGASTKEALQAIQPLLQSLISASEQYGVELDENTQSLVDQAEAQGLAFKTDKQQQMVDLLTVIARKLGAEIPESVNRTTTAFGQVGDAGAGAANKVTTSFDAVPEKLADAGQRGAISFSEALVGGTEAAVTASEAAIGGMVTSTTEGWASIGDLAQGVLVGIAERVEELRRGVVVPISWAPEGGGAASVPLPPPDLPHAARGAYASARAGGHGLVVAEGGGDEIVAPVAQMLDQAFAYAQRGGSLDLGPLVAVLQRESAATREALGSLANRPIDARLHADGREIGNLVVEQLSEGHARLEGAVRRAAAGQRK